MGLTEASDEVTLWAISLRGAEYPYDEYDALAWLTVAEAESVQAWLYEHEDYVVGDMGPTDAPYGSAAALIENITEALGVE